MAAPLKKDTDWSDSSDEEDEQSDVETSVLLGIPDGKIETQEDINDAAVSRIGGHPAFLTSTEPSISSSQCKNCSFPMELLVQLWCPFEDSPMDRALYVFGCAREKCQHKPGSIRAFRGLRYNTTYAVKLEKKREREREKEAARLKAKEEEERKKAIAKVNPFAMNARTPPSGGLFGPPPSFGSGLGTQLFGSSTSDPEPSEPELTTVADEEAPPPPESDSEPDNSEDEAEGSTSDSDESGTDKSILAAPAHTPSSSSPWLAIPSYVPPLYLSTATEYVPPAPKPPKLPASVSSLQDGEDDEVCGGGKSRKAEARRAEKEKADASEAKAWESAMEGYEDSLEVDKVFEKFARVAGYEGEQCIRYELGGTPLPYSNDTIFKSLFPSPSSSSSSYPSTATTRNPISSSTKHSPSSLPTTQLPRRTYNPKAQIIPPCPRCNNPRTFECQLMPNLISVLQKQRDRDSSSQSPQSKSQVQRRDAKDPEERKKELERLLRSGSGGNSGENNGVNGGGGGEGEKRGMEWGTCLIFSCSKDCLLNSTVEKAETKEAKVVKELWAEELVLIQWDE